MRGLRTEGQDWRREEGRRGERGANGREGKEQGHLEKVLFDFIKGILRKAQTSWSKSDQKSGLDNWCKKFLLFCQLTLVCESSSWVAFTVRPFLSGVPTENFGMDGQ